MGGIPACIHAWLPQSHKRLHIEKPEDVARCVCASLKLLQANESKLEIEKVIEQA